MNISLPLIHTRNESIQENKSMMEEKARNVPLNIIGFVAGTIATIVAVYILGFTALIIIITGGCITLAISRTHKRLTNEIEYLKKEINKLKEKKIMDAVIPFVTCLYIAFIIVAY